MVKRMISFSVLVYLILNIFICKGVTVVAGIDCHFDMNFCDWRQNIFDDFNWTRGESHDLYTGPYSDHTTGKGYYIYVDSYNNDKGTIARLMSPMQSSGQYCLTFWYSINGRDIGALNVYIEMNDGNKTVVFSKNKDIGVPDWWKSVLNINAYDTYRIVIEGIIGDGYRGDIAIDDISIRSGSCSIDCDFNDDFCNWMQFDGDNFDWERHKTANTETPSGDDHFIYIATIGKYRQGTAILLSPLLDAGKYCLSLWYSMYSMYWPNIERLRLQIWNTTGTERTMFILESSRGQQWFQKMIFLYSMDVFQIAVEGRVNIWWYSGGIAIDDVTLISCQDCKDPEIANAVTNSSNYEYGSVIKIQCDNGYNLVGDSEIVCKTMGNWSGTASCIPYDCGDLAIPNGTLLTPDGTRFGHGGIQKCNTGFVLIGDPNIKCTANGWSNRTAYCNFIVSDDETNSSPLIAMYVLIPVVSLIVAAIFIVLYMRRRHLSCMKVLKIFRRAREIPSGDSLQGESHSNQVYSNEDLQLDDEYATISGEQTDDMNLGTIYYATVDRSGIKKLGVSKENNQIKSTDGNKSACGIDLNECNTYNVLSAKALNNNLKGGEEHDLDYDSACTRQMKNKASNHDDYSHIGDLEMKYQHTQQFLPQPDIEKNTDYSHIDRVSKGTKFPERLKTDYQDYDEYQNPVLKERKVLEKHTPKIKQIEDQAPDCNNVAQTKEMYESNESENQSNESENHDYFILEKT